MKGILAEAGFPESNIDKISSLLSKKIDESKFESPVFFKKIVSPIASDGYSSSSPILPPNPRLPWLPCRVVYSNPVIGVGDLLVVKQQIKKYEVGEISHIENVLIGESKERIHRRLERKEETVIFETERTEEKEQELTSTERFEIQSEAREVINQQSSNQAGITANYSSISVDVTTNFGFASANSSEESKSLASSC